MSISSWVPARLCESDFAACSSKMEIAFGLSQVWSMQWKCFITCAGWPSEPKLTSPLLQARGKVAPHRRRAAARANGTRPMFSHLALFVAKYNWDWPSNCFESLPLSHLGETLSRKWDKTFCVAKCLSPLLDLRANEQRSLGAQLCLTSSLLSPKSICRRVMLIQIHGWTSALRGPRDMSSQGCWIFGRKQVRNSGQPLTPQNIKVRP